MRNPIRLLPLVLALVASTAVVAGTGAGPAAASTVVLLDDQGLADEAARVVHGEVVSVRPGLARDGVRIYTDVTIRATEMLKGQADGSGLVTFRHWGGELGGRRYVIPGAAELRLGDEVVAFLGDEVGADRAGFTVGLAQGLFHVVRDPATGAASVHRRFGGLNVVDRGTGRPVAVPLREAGRDLGEFLTEMRRRVGR